jgi:hypothetical protein
MWAVMTEPHYASIIVEIGARGQLVAEWAEDAARATVLALRVVAPGRLSWAIGGYDDEPRELWEIPEVAAHVRLVAELVGITDGHNVPDAFSEETIAILALCGTWGSDHPFTVKTGRS